MRKHRISPTLPSNHTVDIIMTMIYEAESFNHSIMFIAVEKITSKDYIFFAILFYYNRGVQPMAFRPLASSWQFLVINNFASQRLVFEEKN